MTTKFFVDAFAVGGDVAPVPDAVQVDGSVSYTQGFGPDYALAPSNPNYLPVPRTQFNQIMNDVTGAIQQIQEAGVPLYFAANTYALYSLVIYDDGVHGPRIFQSKKNSNTDLPTVVASWVWLYNSSNVTIFDNVIFDGSVSNGNAVYFDSGSSTFKLAIADGTVKQQMIGLADVTNHRIYGFGLVTGLSGLTAGSLYYLSTVTPGAITLTVPSGNIVPVGVAYTTTSLFLNIINANVTDVHGITVVSVNGNFTVPAGVSTIQVEVWGAGGGGGGGTTVAGASGAGGGGGGYARSVLSVVAGTVYACNIGNAGPAGVAGGDGGAGSGTTFGVTVVQANGGFGGIGAATTAGGNGGAGGTGVTGQLLIAGSSGGDGNFLTGFGGGAIPGGSGGSAFGGLGGPTSNSANPGITPGGGGAGTQSALGSNGGRGLVVITY